MNKALINKYWKEFCHWKDGGKVLKFYPLLGTWNEIDSYHPWNGIENTYVINDEYVEYRKALAEGKTIQYNPLEVGVDDWEDVTWDVSFEAPIHCYRVKPDEAFKVGDYVVDLDTTDNMFQVTKSNVDRLNKYNGNKDCNYRLWTLEEADDDEWVFVKVNGLHGRFTWCLETKDSLVHKYEDCEYTDAVPYIGQTPEQLGLEK